MADVMQPPQQPVTPVSHIPMRPPATPVSANQEGTSKMMPPPSMMINSASRRPPRKSTLTQQQKNQKRQRATQDQLMTLEVEFNKNPTPTAPVRDRIAHEINMTERSVQIWFQNRRAKIKNIAKRSIESGEDCDSIPESMRNYLAMQAYGPSKAMPAGMFARPPGYFPFPPPMGFGADASAGKTVIQHFHCRSLAIGTWRRVGQNSMDLVIFYSPERACITYYIHNEQSGYKIEYPFAWIKTITLEQGDIVSPAEGASQGSGGLIVELNKPPKFYMDSSGSGGFYECGDFTEDRQASKVMLHHLGGPSKVLSGQLAKLISLDAYQNRHHFDPSAFAVVSAPVSPVGHRPASQPNHMIHPHHQMGLFPQLDPGMGLMGPPGPRGHKRQRSRSVPVAIDFSMIRQPMPSFLIQHDGNPAPHHDPHIFAPQPQHQPPHPHAFVPPPHGQPLHIDTSPAAFGMDLRPFPAPMSATTLNSPSEFGTPGFFATTGDSMHNPMVTTNFGNFLAVDPSVMLGTSNTPLSATSHDPVIADHSPPLNGMGRSQSTGDVFATDDSSAFAEDGTYLSETFNKQINLPFRSPIAEDNFHSPVVDGSITFDYVPPSADGTMHFDTSSQEQVSFDSPPQPQSVHQDSGISFGTPSQMHSQEHPQVMGEEPSSMLYNDSKVYHSPAQMQQMQHQHNASPLYQQHPNHEYDVMGYVNPSSLGQQRQQHV